jgi:hypothetical protein
METPKGRLRYFKRLGSIEKIIFKKKFRRGELISFSDLIFKPTRDIILRPNKIGKKRKKLK